MKSDKVMLFFSPKAVAVIGANKESNKIGHVIFRNMLESFKGDVFPVNPSAAEILGKKSYKTVNEIPHKVDVAVIVVPASAVPKVMEQCGRKKVKGCVIISSGFAETGNDKLERRVAEIAREHKISVIGPNCLGVFDPYSGIDALFLSKYKMARPEKGNISFITQSGAVGASVLDWMAYEGLGFSKFISYGNAMDIGDADMLEFLGNDQNTKVIVMYLEGTKDGRKLMEVARHVSRKKPIIVMKSGRTCEGTRAAKSHTASLAGEDLVYDAAFRQSGMIRADTIVDAINYAKAFVGQVLPKGNRILVITNGGGFGVMATDAIIGNGLCMAELNKNNGLELASKLPPYAAVRNPLDLVGDADTRRYKHALDYAAKDRSVDAVLCMILLQTVNLDADVVEVITEFSNLNAKPIVVCALGGDYTKVNTRTLERAGIPCYKDPSTAARTLAVMSNYAGFRQKN